VLLEYSITQNVRVDVARDAKAGGKEEEKDFTTMQGRKETKRRLSPSHKSDMSSHEETTRSRREVRDRRGFKNRSSSEVNFGQHEKRFLG